MDSIGEIAGPARACGLPAWVLRGVQEACPKRGALLIADEIQTVQA